MKKFDFGWIDSPENKIKPVPTKDAKKDIGIGLAIGFIGVGYAIVSAFLHGAKAYETSEYDILHKLGKY